MSLPHIFSVSFRSLVRRFFLGCFLIGVTASAQNKSPEPQVKASFDQNPVEVRQPVVLTIEVDNLSQPNIVLPNVKGLMLVNESNVVMSEGITLNGFNMTQESSFSQEITLMPLVAGDMVIPSFTIMGSDHRTVQVPELVLHVRASSTTNKGSQIVTIPPNAVVPPSSTGPVIMPPNATSNPPASESPDAVSTGDPNDPNSVPIDPDGQPAKLFLTVTPHLSSTDIYVGQSVPITMRSYSRGDVATSQDSLPTINGTDFLLNNLTIMQPYPADVGGTPYQVEQFESAITPVRVGDFPLQLSRETNWVRPQQQNNVSPFDLFLRRPPTDRDSVKSNRIIWHVHELPRENKPANFNGAVGNFQVVGTVLPTQVVVGEPITIRFSVTGEGNFDLINCPAFAESPDWKFYKAQAEVHYNDPSSTRGEKNFQLEAIPHKSGTLTLPPAQLSFFNPESKQYITLTVPLNPIIVTNAPETAHTPEASADGADASTDSDVSITELRPNRLLLGQAAIATPPLYQSSAFLTLQAGLLILVGLGSIAYLLRLRTAAWTQTQQMLSRQRQEIYQKDQAVEQFLQAGDTTQFFLAARAALQYRFAQRWKLAPEAITWGEVRQRDSEIANEIKPFFDQADAVLFSGQTVELADLPAWKKHLQSVVKKWEGKK